MKNKFLFIMLAVIVSLSFCFISCKEKESKEKTKTSTTTTKKSVNAETVEYTGDALPVNYDDAFTPDYSVIVPEEATSVRLTAGIDTSGGSKEAGIIPGVRDISKYKTKYDTKFDTSTYVEAKIENVPNKKNKSNSNNAEKSEEKLDLRILYMQPGWTKEEPNIYDSDMGLLPTQPQQVWISLNEEATKKQFSEEIEISGGNDKIAYTIELLDVNGNPLKNGEKSKYMLIKFSEKIKPNTTVKIKGTFEKRFNYLNSFWSKSVSNYAKNSRNKKNIVTITFSHELDESSISPSIITLTNTSSKSEVPIKKENIEVLGNTITIFNIDLKQGETYKLKIGTEVKDVFGRKLLNPNTLYDVEPPRKQSYAKFLNSGVKILEAQFAPKLLIDYMNVYPDSVYGVRKINKDENIFANSIAKAEMKNKLNSDALDTRMFEEIPLDDYLENGKGFIKFNASVGYDYYNWWSKKTEKETYTNDLTLQVTDIGVTARISINKVVALVTSLETGKPIEGAKVEFRSIEPESSIISTGRLFGDGTTDKNGAVVIPFTENVAKILNKSNEYNLVLIVEKDRDRTMFRPNSHNPWRAGINQTAIKGTLDPIERTFMFVDRKIYKPGETVTFRGIDRDQLLGKLSTPKGDYKISLNEPGWNSATLQSQDGTLSENGGFYGSFKLADDIKPGTYYISYERKDNSKDKYRYNQISIIVAEFERAKFQAAVEMPNVTLVAGDSISANLSASYLAGGSLGGAEYTAKWFKSPTYFKPESNETNGFSFGPNDYYDGRDYYSETKGVLSANGTASISGNTEKIKGGKTYRYRVEAAVTDASNQRIVASGATFVHPAKFYIGLAKPSGSSGFVKANTKLDFQYILTTPSGDILSNTNPVKSLKYKLTHDEWTLVQEKGSNGKVYTRYNKDTVTDSEDTISVSTKGKISINVKNAGWYTLRVTGIDSNGNEAVTDLGFYATGSGKSSWWGNNSDELKLTPDQSVYNPGDVAQVLLESPLPKGTYLITVEREGIFTEEVRTIESPTDVIEVQMASNYAPVVYVSVSSYSVRNGPPTHEYGEPDLDKPTGYYGACALKVTPAIKAFSVSITADKPSYRPGDKATLTLHATKGGKPFANTELTVMAVDRGVIDLVDYHVDDPIDFFYSENNFPLRVKGGDNRAYLMDPVTYSIKNLQGGDSDEEKEDERKDFRPTALFEPEVRTDENGDATVTFTVPDNLTTYRITAFGVKDDLFALSENEIQVRNPVNIQQVQPRKLRFGDTAEAGVLITNLEPTEQNVTVTLEVKTPTGNTAEDEANGRITIPGSGFVDGNNTATIKIPSGASAPVYFEIGTTTPGTVELVYTIKSDAINEKLISPIKIDKEATYVYETLMETGTIDDSKNKATAEQKLVIPSAANDGKKTGLKVTLDTTRLGLLGGAVNYLFDYPHGCMEQQSARVLPLVIFSDYIDVFGLDSEISNPKKCAISFMKKWKNFQMNDGGFAYWPEGTESNVYVSTRILHIAALAKIRGYSDKEIGFDAEKLASYLQKQKETPYSLYVLSLYGKDIGTSAASKFNSEQEKLSFIDMSYLALACLNSGDKNTAEKIGSYLRSYLDTSKRSVAIKKNNSGVYNWWEGDVSLMANLMQLYVSLDREDNMVDLLVFSILQEQQKGYWRNTAETARVLESIYTLIKTRNLDKTNLKATAKINGSKVMEDSFKGAGAKPKTLEIPLNSGNGAKLPREKEIPVEFEKNGKGHLYYTLEMKYPLPIARQTARNEGIEVIYEIEDFDTGVELKPSGKDSTVITLESGKLYRAKVAISSNRKRDYIALRAPIPSGAEILDSKLATTGGEAKITNENSNGRWWGHWLSNSEIYDNEADFYWDDFEEGSTTVTFTFRAVRRGVYPTPSAFAECMYEPEVYGRSNAALFIIK